MSSVKHQGSLRVWFMLAFAVILIPMLIFSMVMYNVSMNNERLHIDTTYYERFQNMSSSLSALLKQCSSVVADTSFLEECFALDERGDVLPKDSMLCSLLEKAERRLEEGVSCTLMVRGGTDMFTSSEKVHYQDYENEEQKLHLLSASGLYMEILKAKEPALLRLLSSVSERQSGMVYIYPISLSQPTPVDVVYIFWIDSDYIMNCATAYIGEFEGSFFIHSARYLREYFEYTTADISFLNVLPVKGTGLVRFRFGKEDCILLRHVDQTLSLTYSLAMPASFFYKDLTAVRTTFVWLIVLLVVVLTFFAAFLVRLLYAPVSALYARVTSKKPTLKENEFIAVLDSFDSTVRQNEFLETQVLDFNRIAVNQFCAKLLLGAYDSMEQVQKVCARTGLQLPYPCFAVGCVLNASNQDARLIDQVFHVVQRIVLPDTKIIPCEMWNEHNLCFIINFSNEAQRQETFRIVVEALFQAVCPLLQRSLGVGCIYNDMLKIADSFVEASVAVRLTNTDVPSIRYYDERFRQGDPPANREEASANYLNLLEDALSHNEPSVAKRAVSEIVASLSCGVESFLLFRYYTARIISSIHSQYVRLNAPFSNDDLAGLLDYHSSAEFLEKANRAIDELCRASEQQAKNADALLTSQMLECIRQNFTRYDFSFNELLDTFHLSRAHGSALLQGAVGMTFAKYVACLRMDEFKRMLIYSTRAINDCIKAVGYNDVSSFNRKFKQLEGVTPSGYRERYQNSGE